MDEAKPFLIPKREVWEAFKRVKANQGAAGVDGQSIEDFEANLSGNLYKLWNRMSSGSYFRPPVRRVDIPKASGGIRPLGIATVADRIAQEVVRRYQRCNAATDTADRISFNFVFMLLLIKQLRIMHAYHPPRCELGV